MYNNVGPQPGIQQPPASSQPNPFGSAFNVAGSGLIRGGLGAYGGKILGSSSEYVQSNISRYFSDPQYYFQVNDHYVKNKLKVVLFPFLHRGHWTRITEPVGGRLSYKPPIYDINAPDLYIPLMAFGTYVVLAGLSLGLHGKFSPEALNLLFIKGLLGWFMQASLLKVTLLSLGSGEAPLLDIIAYAGYTFTGNSVMCHLQMAVGTKNPPPYPFFFLLVHLFICSVHWKQLRTKREMMSCLNISTNVSLNGVDTSSIIFEATSIVANLIGKSEVISFFFIYNF
ncbi:hypothetical protein AHAS_Ahas20G0288100 [Arachis hypogaea]